MMATLPALRFTASASPAPPRRRADAARWQRLYGRAVAGVACAMAAALAAAEVAGEGDGAELRQLAGEAHALAGRLRAVRHLFERPQ